jgi:predicted O-linked N-acetylglucosamine transferase (SPINDLY family)
MLLRLIRGLIRREPAAPDGEADPLATALERGRSLYERGELYAALKVYADCARAHPREVGPHIRAGNVLRELWRVEEGVREHAKALELAPGGNAVIHSSVLFSSHYLAAPDPQRLFESHRQYGRLLAAGLAGDPPPQRGVTPDPDRRIRVGYVSPNFSRHSVGYFIEPVIAQHDRARFEVYCYSNLPTPDDTTARIRSCAHAWRDVHGIDDDALAQSVAADRIDVLVDLAGHTAGNRLPVFARRAAPVQMTWLGYPDTTGLAAIDYRITDDIADPAPRADARCTERLLRLPGLFLCYQPPHDAPAVSDRGGDSGPAVFCSFNVLDKVNEPLIGMWADILRAVPGSRLLVKSRLLKREEVVRRVADCFGARGIEAARIELHGWSEDRADHLNRYARADVALDTYPYNGTTTTCEALWMGVPVVTLAGELHMSRVGAALLEAVGLPDLVAASPESYVRTAVELARNGERRRALRAELRDRLVQSPLLDHAGFTRKLEAAIERAWLAWCSARR